MPTRQFLPKDFLNYLIILTIHIITNKVFGNILFTYSKLWCKNSKYNGDSSMLLSLVPNLHKNVYYYYFRVFE